MGTRELLFRQKLANQIEKVLGKSERVFTSQKLSGEWVDEMLQETQDLVGQLTIFKFLNELPENEDLQLAFLELDEEQRELKEEPKKVDSYGEEILKEIDEFEATVAEDVQEEIEIEDQDKSDSNSSSAYANETFEEEVLPADSDAKEEEVADEKDFQEKKANKSKPEMEEPLTSGFEEQLEALKAASTEGEKNSPFTQISQTEINDLVQGEKLSLADKLSEKTIAKLGESITLNERFLFANELFNGNMEAFKRTLNELDHIATLEDANRYIEQQLAVEFQWNLENTEVQKFVTLVSRRFK